MEVAYSTLLARPVANVSSPWAHKTRKLSLDGEPHPRIVSYVSRITTIFFIFLIFIIRKSSLGGDHTIVLPILRALHKVYGPVTVIHFDAHLDTWPGYPGAVTAQSLVTHGTFFYLAWEEGLMNTNCVHAGIRCKMVVHISSFSSLEDAELIKPIYEFTGTRRCRQRQCRRIPDH